MLRSTTPSQAEALREACRTAIAGRARRRDFEDLDDVLRRTHGLCERRVRPQALEYDRRAWADTSDFPWELVAEGGRLGLLSVSLPSPDAGGPRLMVTTLAAMMEEMAAGCAGVATIFGAHGLGAAPLGFGGPYFWTGALREVAEAERTAEPQIMAFAITEPPAGTDMENPDLVDRAHLACLATKVSGGYRLNGTKHFISNGSEARWITVYMPVDRDRPRATMTCFLVDARSEGFRVGHVEHKMGQRACPAAEIIFEDCFVPEENIVGRVGDGATNMMCVLIASRPCVGAIGTGIARGAYERLRDWLTHDPEGQPLLEHQQVQLALAQMEEDIRVARLLWLDAALDFDTVSIGALLADPAARLFSRVPQRVRSSTLVRRQLSSGLARGAAMMLMRRRLGDAGLTRSLALSSMAKARGGDTAMRVTGQALEIAGLSSGPIRAELEKLLRDAKLCQIYEGTNQLNRLEVYEGLCLGEELGLLPIGADAPAPTEVAA